MTKPKPFQMTQLELAVGEMGEVLFQVSDIEKVSRRWPNLAQLIQRRRDLLASTEREPEPVRGPSNRGAVTNATLDQRKAAA